MSCSTMSVIGASVIGLVFGSCGVSERHRESAASAIDQRDSSAVNHDVTPSDALSVASKPDARARIYGSQREWIQYFSDRNERMVSAPALYELGKSGSDDVLRSIRAEYLLGDFLVTSTRVRGYADKKRRASEIVHGYGNADAEEVRKVRVPGLWMTCLAEERSGDVYRYLQALFDTTDRPQQIRRTLERLAGKSASEIYVGYFHSADVEKKKRWGSMATSDVVNEIAALEHGNKILQGEPRPIELGYVEGRFVIDGYLNFGEGGARVCEGHTRNCGAGRSFAVPLSPCTSGPEAKRIDGSWRKGAASVRLP